MSLKQISVLIENKAGALAQITDALAKKNVNLYALSIADTERFGILRMILSDNEAAIAALKELGLIIQETEVVGIQVPDEPGALSRVLDILRDADINMEYLYAFFSRTRTGTNASVVIRVENTAEAERLLSEAGITLISWPEKV